MSKYHAVVGIGTRNGNIVMATVENRYQGKHRGTRYPLFASRAVPGCGRTRADDARRRCDQQMKNGLAKEPVPLVENKVGLEVLMNSYLEASWAKLMTAMLHDFGIKVLTERIQ